MKANKPRKAKHKTYCHYPLLISVSFFFFFHYLYQLQLHPYMTWEKTWVSFYILTIQKTFPGMSATLVQIPNATSSKFIVMNSEQLTFGQVPTSSLPAVDEKWGQPDRWPWECECEYLSKRGYWRCSFCAHTSLINSKDEWMNTLMNHTKA